MPTSAAQKSLGTVGQFSVFFISFMVVTLSLSIFLSHAKEKRKEGEDYLQFFICDMTCRKKRKKVKNELRGLGLRMRSVLILGLGLGLGLKLGTRSGIDLGLGYSLSLNKVWDKEFKWDTTL
eukprot:13442810-Ditylum_brightwellii.AAC.1